MYPSFSCIHFARALPFLNYGSTHRTIQERFFCPNLHNIIRIYITGCDICQLFKNTDKFARPYQNRFNINTPSLTKISIDFKHMPVSNNRYKFILIMLCETSNFLVAEPTKTTHASEVCKVLMKHFIEHPHTPYLTKTQLFCPAYVNGFSSLVI